MVSACFVFLVLVLPLVLALVSVVLFLIGGFVMCCYVVGIVHVIAWSVHCGRYGGW